MTMLIVKKAAEARKDNEAWKLMIQGAVALKEHRCTWCGGSVPFHGFYYRWLSVDKETPVVNKMHTACLFARDSQPNAAVDFEYEFFKNQPARFF